MGATPPAKQASKHKKEDQGGGDHKKNEVILPTGDGQPNGLKPLTQATSSDTPAARPTAEAKRASEQPAERKQQREEEKETRRWRSDIPSLPFSSKHQRRVW